MNLSHERKLHFMDIASDISHKSTCGYKVGCVGVVTNEESYNMISEENLDREEGMLVIKAWNETVKGETYCQSFDGKGNRLCIREIENLKGKDYHKVCSIHAEVNLIAKCAKYGIKTNGMILCVTNSPCYICAKSIIQSGIKEVYYQAEHTDTTGIDLIKRNGEILIAQLDSK